jgi:hypothetical protein
MRLARHVVFLIAMGPLYACGGGSSSIPSSNVPSFPQNPPPATGSSSNVAYETPQPSDFVVPGPVKSAGATPKPPTDPNDKAPLNLNSSTAPLRVLASATLGNIHIFPISTSNAIPLNYDARGQVVSESTRRSRAATVFGYPGDLLYYGGAVVSFATVHNIYLSTNYVNCGTTCWGEVASDSRTAAEVMIPLQRRRIRLQNRSTSWHDVPAGTTLRRSRRR